MDVLKTWLFVEIEGGKYRREIRAYHAISNEFIGRPLHIASAKFSLN